MIKRAIISIIFVYFVSLSVFCQVNDTIQIPSEPIDSLAMIGKALSQLTVKKREKTKIASSKDTVQLVNSTVEVDRTTEKILKKKEPFKPNPTRAVIYSAIFPGLGQIYNRKYWKLPLMYSGFVGIVYAITWNGRMYSDYTKAYKGIMSPDYIARKDDYIYLFAKAGDQYKDPARWSDSDRERFRNSIRNRRDYNRRNRDLSIIGGVALYALCMIDAYVDAQLYDFDISPNLSLRVEPKIGLDSFSQISFGLQCNVKF